ncbi:uncharacterized protein LOC115421755 [Sphaeramia orbicularis]|uniref:uncharacterized protein LOC115421755 n=1 Tax=Sphaeramia orbicularis TaxID=375764 RepID=UPI00117D02EA|nr:uncharacterized protein LOC115421755 [Sphaeramia orbicularis]
MQFVTGGTELGLYMLLFVSLHLWGRLSASTSPPPLPVPTLDIFSRSKDSVVLVCRVPERHRGVLFKLYRITDMVDSQEQPSGAEEVQFTVRVNKGESSQYELFCCLYKDKDGRYSAFSSYLQLDQTDAPPTRPIPSFPPPVLSVEPSSGVVKQGDTLAFRCSLPVPQPQYQSHYNSNNKPLSFFLLRRGTEEPVTTSTIPQPQASQGSNPVPQPGVFNVGPVRGGEEGEYTCIYQVTRKRGLVNSSVSNVVHITIKAADLLPTPTLALQQQTDVWHLLCKGSPAYPGAVFSLYYVDTVLPVATQHTKVIDHQAIFPVPVQDTPVALYQCDYSVLLGKEWRTSERSLPLVVTKGGPAPPSLGGVDWPLVLGCFSSVVLFLCSIALIIVVVLRKVKAAAEEKKKREEAQFWTQVHAKDHVVDLTLRRASFTSMNWSSGDTSAETAPRSPLWNALSTFTTPINPDY